MVVWRAFRVPKWCLPGNEATTVEARHIMAAPNSFLGRFTDPAPALLKYRYFDPDETPKTVRVSHRLGSVPSSESCSCLEALQEIAALRELCEFYKKHNGVELCRRIHSRFREATTLLEFKPVEGISAFTSQYLPEGERGWVIDCNKSKTLYRGSNSWIAFAEMETGPSCLTTFSDGDNAGNVFYLCPQPHFNILRPIARGFNLLLERIAKDPAAFLRLVRVTVSIPGDDGYNYGYVPVEYVADSSCGDFNGLHLH